jgi:hypothetical protein
MRPDTPLGRSTVKPESVSRVVIPSVVDEFLAERAGFWASTMADDGPPVRVDLPALLQQLRSLSQGPIPHA